MCKGEIILCNTVMQFAVFEVDLSLLAVQNIFQNRHKQVSSNLRAL